MVCLPCVQNELCLVSHLSISERMASAIVHFCEVTFFSTSPALPASCKAYIQSFMLQTTFSTCVKASDICTHTYGHLSHSPSHYCFPCRTARSLCAPQAFSMLSALSADSLCTHPNTRISSIVMFGFCRMSFLNVCDLHR